MVTAPAFLKPHSVSHQHSSAACQTQHQMHQSASHANAAQSTHLGSPSQRFTYIAPAAIEIGKVGLGKHARGAALRHKLLQGI